MRGGTVLTAAVYGAFWTGPGITASVDGLEAADRTCLAVSGEIVTASGAEPCDWFLVTAVPGAYDNGPEDGGRSGATDSILYACSPVAAGICSLSFEAGRDPAFPAAGTFYLAATAPGLPLPDTITCREPLHSVSLSMVQVVVRDGDDYLDYLFEAFGTPFVMAPRSTPEGFHQGESRLGFDCAGLAVYGARRMGLDVWYLGPTGILPWLEPVLPGLYHPAEIGGEALYLDSSGSPAPIGDDGIRPGDILHFGCQVSVFLEDRGTPGLLDPLDMVVQSWFDGPMVCTLEDNGFYGLPLRAMRWGQTTDRSTTAN